MLLKKLELLSQQKYDIQAEKYPDWCDANKYIEELWKEIAEVQEEIRENNIVHLQDEIWDVFWDLLWMIESLKRQWMIDSLDDILHMAVEKYRSRVAVCGEEWWRHKIKQQQKIELAEKHQARYGI